MAAGHLMIIGGCKDRTDDDNVSARVVAMAGCAERRFVVVTLAIIATDLQPLHSACNDAWFLITRPGTGARRTPGRPYGPVPARSAR